MSAPKPKGAGPGRGVRKAPGSSESVRRARPSSGEEAHIPWGRRNFTLLAAGGGSVALGFILLAVGDTVFAPILIVGGYLGLIPWGILAGPGKGPAASSTPTGKPEASGE
jgi:hypothetical protein